MKQAVVTTVVVLLVLYGCYSCATVLIVSPNYVVHHGAPQ